jgi:hypothetical protein
VPEYLYEQGRLETGGLPLAELQQRVHVNARAQAADAAVDFSRRIREPVQGGAASLDLNLSGTNMARNLRGEEASPRESRK